MEPGNRATESPERRMTPGLERTPPGAGPGGEEHECNRLLFQIDVAKKVVLVCSNCLPNLHLVER